MTPEELKDRTCNFEDCRHLNSENICCIHNQENCILYRLKKENTELKAFKEKCRFNVSDICKEIETENNLSKAKEIIKKLLYEYQRLCFVRKETIAEAEQFIKENSTYKRIQKAKYNYTD